MHQLNIRLTREFEVALREFMRRRGLPSKSEAVRVAVAEALAREVANAGAPDFWTWIGLALGAPVNATPRFASDDDLWR